MISLYPYQEKAKGEIRTHFKNERKRVLLQMPTGAGKTRTFCSLISDLFNADDQFRCILVAHVDELLLQIGETLSEYGIEYGTIKSGRERDLSFQVQVASIGTLRNEDGLDGKVDLIVIDEAHHTGANSYNELFNRFPNAYFLGATATPCRNDGQVLADYYDAIVLGPSIRELIDKHKLAPVKILRPQHQIEGIDQIEINGNDYNETALGDFMNRPEIRAKLVQSYLTHCYGKKGIVYAVNKSHAMQICFDYKEQQIEATYIVSGDESGIEPGRSRRVTDFINGKIKILVNVGIFTEGFNCPDADFVQLARPTKSVILYLQQVGRALRKSERKKFATILDNAGLTLEHGSFVSNEYDWENIFKYGLGNEAYIQNGNGGELALPLENQIGIQEGEEELIAEVYGLEEDEYIVEFFSDSLRNLYEHIRGIQLVNGAGYLSERSIGAVKELEPHLYSIADKNFQFFEVLKSSIDLFQIELNANTFEKKRLQDIFKDLKFLEIDSESKYLINIIKHLKKIGIELDDDQINIIQNKVKLSKSDIEQLLKGNFDSEDISKEIASTESRSIEIEKYILELTERLQKIKKYALEGLIAENEFYKTLETEELAIISPTKFEKTEEIDFSRFTTARVNLLLSDHKIDNSNMVKGAFNKALNSGESSLSSEIELLYKDPLVYHNVTGMGTHKAKIIRELIEHYGKLDNQKVKLEDINRRFKTLLEYTNDLQLLSRLVLSDLNPIQHKVISSNSKYNLFKSEKELTLKDISKELNANINTVKGSATKLNDGWISEKFDQCIKIFREETIKNLRDTLKETDKDIWMFSKTSWDFINQKYGVNFSLRGYSEIFSRIENESRHIYFNEKCSTLYVSKGPISKIFDDLIKEVMATPNANSKTFNTDRLTETEINLMEIIIKEEINPFKIQKSEMGIKIKLEETGLGKKEKVFEALIKLGKWSTSSEIFEECEKSFPGDFADANTISSDYLSKFDDFKGETEKRLHGKKYGLEDWLIPGRLISRRDIELEMDNFLSFKSKKIDNKMLKSVLSVSDLTKLQRIKSDLKSFYPVVSEDDIKRFKRFLNDQEAKNGYTIQNDNFRNG